MPARELRILHCLRAPVGGLFRHVCDLAAAQAGKGHRVGVVVDSITMSAPAAARLDALSRHLELGVRSVPMPRLPGFGDIRALDVVRRHFDEHRPDVVHGHGAKGGAYARLPAPAESLRAYTPHGGSLHYHRKSPAGVIFLAMERMLARRTDLFLFESEFSQRVFREKVGSTDAAQIVVHNGLQPSDFEPVPAGSDAADFVFIGELRELKGVDLLIEAAAGMARDGQRCRVTIVGSGPDAERFNALARDRGVDDLISFPGPMPAVEAFRLGRCVVVPSRAESLPYVVLEAAAASKPLIATNVGGIGEIFADQSGRLVPPGDPDALRAAMTAFLLQPVLGEADAERLRAHVGRHFRVDQMAERILAAYRSSASLRPG